MVTKYSIVDCMQRLQTAGFSDEQVYALAKGFEELQSILDDEIKLQVRNKGFRNMGIFAHPLESVKSALKVL